MGTGCAANDETCEGFNKVDLRQNVIANAQEFSSTLDTSDRLRVCSDLLHLLNESARAI